MKKQIIYLILCAISVVLAYGKPIEIKGFMAVGLWFAPPALMIFCIKRNTKPFRRASAAVLTLYVIATGLFLIRENAFYTYSRNFSMNPRAAEAPKCVWTTRRFTETLWYMTANISVL